MKTQIKKITLVAASTVLMLSQAVRAETVEPPLFGYQYKLGSSSYDWTNISSSEDFSESLFLGFDYGGVQGTTFAAVRGSLATGSVGIKASASNGVGPGTGGGDYATIILRDTLYFDLTAYDVTDTFDIFLGYTIHGTLGINQSLLTASLLVQNETNGDRSSVSVQYSGFNGSDVTSALSSQSVRQASKNDEGSYTLRVELSGGEVNQVSLQNWMIGENSVDFFNSATIGLDTSLAYSSASGAFLTGDMPAIPLPASGLFLICSIGGLGALRRFKTTT